MDGNLTENKTLLLLLQQRRFLQEAQQFLTYKVGTYGQQEPLVLYSTVYKTLQDFYLSQAPKTQGFQPRLS